MNIRIGLVAASRIAQAAVVDPARSVPGVTVSAVAARDHGRANEAADRWSIPRAFGSYAEMIGSDEVDAAYIATPASLHREWTIAAIEAGKHVLCEKPFAANATDAARMADAAAGADVVVMEAFHWRYHPLVSQMQSVLDAGILGTIERIDARFEVHASAIPETDIRWDLSIGGGAMMDIGCYPASWVRWAIDGEPTVDDAHAECPVPNIDGSMRAELSWPSGVTGTIFGSMVSDEPGHNASIEIVGSDATMYVDNPLAPQAGASLQIRSRDGVVDIPVLPGSTYESQLIAFRDAVAFGAPFPTTADEGVATMSLIDACYRAGGLPVRPTKD
ncbi:MAG: Gfo/Idh/MocA family oxidoreductase [Actinomycetota bacterium]